MAAEHAFDPIIGYEDIKEELKGLADVLRYPERYEAFGIKPPKGLLIYGEPGIGKTLMAGCLIRASERKAFTCRKSEGKETFTQTIHKTFEEALAAAPSIVLLDDMDKFANDDEWHMNSEEFVTIQSCIDEFCHRGVFVAATANSLDLLPDSLIRKGRFDRHIEVSRPEPETAAKIVQHYLAERKTIGEVDCGLIAAILGGESCATLESIVNEAGIYAVQNGRSRIEMEDMIRACVRVLYNAPAAPSPAMKEHMDRLSYHEAGHAVAAWALEPGSVHLVSILGGNGRIGGVTASGRDRCFMSKEETEQQIIITLAGKAATELQFGETDAGASGDMRKAALMMNNLAKMQFAFGAEIRGLGSSELYSARKEEYISRELERLYQEAKKLLAANRQKLDGLAGKLMEKQTLSGGEIREAMEGLKKSGSKTRVHAA